jgi:endonuclease/exonuclease/phosphatase family metal-dependent hydrolase
MRIATYNVEWFDSLFNNAGHLLIDDGWSSRRDVTRRQQAEALGIVFTALDADAVMIIEAPDTNSRRSTTRALMAFAEYFDLRTRACLTGFANDTQQEIALLFDPDRLTVRHDPQTMPNAPRFDGVFEIDLDVDASLDRVQFSKPPLELAVETAGGTRFRMIGAHLKSKAPHGARSRNEIMRFSIASRRKQLAQAIWLRRRIEGHLAAGEEVMLLGDLNDGPGLDEFESLFGRSSVEIVLGDGGATGKLYDPHAAEALSSRIAAQPSTSRFHIVEEKRYLQALLDYIMVSDGLRARASGWRIWHPFDDPRCWSVPELRDALLTASDHFPVSLDIEI